MFLFKYLFNKSVISSSPLFEGFNFILKSKTLLSKKYNPVTAKFDLGFFGFSIIFNTLFFLLIEATPYNEGFFTGCKKTFAPCFNFTLDLSLEVKFWP